MSTQKQSALGTILEMDPANTTAVTNLVAATLVKTMTPPGREREEADGRALGDILDVPTQGGEAQSEMIFTQFWHPGDTNHELMDTQFGVDTNPNSIGTVAAFRITYPHGGTKVGDTAPTDSFSGYVRRLGPESLEPTGVYMREVAIRRTTAVTRATRVLA